MRIGYEEKTALGRALRPHFSFWPKAWLAGQSDHTPIIEKKVEELVMTPSLGALNRLAQSVADADPKLSFAQAFAKVYTDPGHRELVNRERGERRAMAPGG